MNASETVAALVQAETDLIRRWSARFSGDTPPVVAADLLRATVRHLDGGSTSAVTDPALGLGVFRAQQGRTATSLVEDVLSLRPLLWGHIAANGQGEDLGALLLLQSNLADVLDLAVREAVAAFVAESTRVLANAATKDVLTGIGNRAAFEDALARAIASTGRDGPPSLLMLDLDGFKQVNDTLGHLVGDDVLVRVAEIVATACRPNDVGCRLGGDEFVVILPSTTAESAKKVAKRILDDIRKDSQLTALSTPVGVSIGIACVPIPRDNAHLVGMADGALYRAKRAGGHTMEVATDADDPGAVAQADG